MGHWAPEGDLRQKEQRRSRERREGGARNETASRGMLNAAEKPSKIRTKGCWLVLEIREFMV